MPICQDTGMTVIFMEIGQDVHLVGGNLEEAVNAGVAKGYTEGYLRKSVVGEPLFNRKNTTNNTPAILHTTIVPGDKVKIKLAPKGFGSENKGALKMLVPADGVEGVKKVEAYVTNITITGTSQAPDMWIPTNTGAVYVGNRLYTAPPYIDMPDFSAGVKAEAIAAGTYYTTNYWPPKEFTGNGVNIDKSIYVDGPGGITISGCSFKGEGAICAKGNIGISGNTVKSDNGSAICIYSSDGNINISASGITIVGTVYAPKGIISINGSNITIIGHVIAQEIQSSASNLEIIGGTGDLGFLPGGSVALCE